MRLGGLYQERAHAALHEWQHQQDADARRLALSPLEGWPGKNEGERKIAAERVFAGDEGLQGSLRLEAEAHAAIMLIDGEILAVEAERRALEWELRGQLVERLGSAGMERRVDTAFETVADAALDAGSFRDEMPFSLQEELPF